MLNTYQYSILNWKNEKGKYETYWNDETIKSVASDTGTGNFTNLETHIVEQGFELDFKNCLEVLKLKGRKITGVGADIASGSMWLTANILKNFSPDLSHFYSIDYSELYISKLGPNLLNHYNIKPEKLSLCLGSFYEIQLPEKSLDFIVMAQAFHHADDPNKLLKEIHRVLKKEGFLIMIGELFIPKSLYLKCYLNYLLCLVVSSSFFPSFIFKLFSKLKHYKRDNLSEPFQTLYFPPDPDLGDHYHLKCQYENMFKNNDFKFINIKSNQKNHLAYVLYK